MSDRPPGDPPPAGFTHEELARLLADKAAVATGFYNGWPTRAVAPIAGADTELTGARRTTNA